MIKETIRKIEDRIESYKNPVVMSSFGKDSMVMLHIIFRVMKFRLPVVYHRDPWFPWKNDFADRIIKEWKLVVHDWPPTNCGIKVKNEAIEIVSRYQIGNNSGIDIPKNIIEPEAGEPFACGLEMIERPKCNFHYPWDLAFIGHRSADVDPYDGPVPLSTDLVEQKDAPALAFPLKNWTDEQLWDYIEKKRIIVQTGSRYDMTTQKDQKSKLFNNDYVTACTRCIDPRQSGTVFCPKLNRSISNISANVLRLVSRPSYINYSVC